MNKKIRKMLIVQLTIIEIILIILLFDTEANSCVVDHENNNLLVYNYGANTLLASKVVKEDVELEIENIDEDEDASETVEELEEVQDEVEQVSEPEPVVETVIATPIAIKDVDYTVAQNLVNYAVQFVGYPYVYGGNSLTNGTDCSGFTKLIYAEYGVDLPRVAYDQSFVGVEVPISEIQIGDLVLSGYNGTTHHVAIYIGNNQIVHALNSDVGIVITDLYNMPITHVRRVL